MTGFINSGGSGEEHLTPEDKGASVNVPVGEWIDVPEGMVAAPGTYVDRQGVLRESSSGSCVVWHNKGCEIRGIQPVDIEYDSNGAPWCPTCFKHNTDKSKLREMFGPEMKVKTATVLPQQDDVAGRPAERFERR